MFNVTPEDFLKMQAFNLLPFLQYMRNSLADVYTGGSMSDDIRCRIPRVLRNKDGMFFENNPHDILSEPAPEFQTKVNKNTSHSGNDLLSMFSSGSNFDSFEGGVKGLVNNLVNEKDANAGRKDTSVGVQSTDTCVRSTDTCVQSADTCVQSADTAVKNAVKLTYKFLYGMLDLMQQPVGYSAVLSGLNYHQLENLIESVEEGDALKLRDFLGLPQQNGLTVFDYGFIYMYFKDLQYMLDKVLFVLDVGYEMLQVNAGQLCEVLADSVLIHECPNFNRIENFYFDKGLCLIWETDRKFFPYVRERWRHLFRKGDKVAIH